MQGGIAKFICLLQQITSKERVTYEYCEKG